MKRNKLTKLFMLMTNWKNDFGLHDIYKNNSALLGLKGCNSPYWRSRIAHQWGAKDTSSWWELQCTAWWSSARLRRWEGPRCDDCWCDLHSCPHLPLGNPRNLKCLQESVPSLPIPRCSQGREYGMQWIYWCDAVIPTLFVALFSDVCILMRKYATQLGGCYEFILHISPRSF